ncbi:hypothetical protein V8E54_004184 [Elaphomyces granulatus]
MWLIPPMKQFQPKNDHIRSSWRSKKQNLKLSWVTLLKDLVGQELNVVGHKVKIASANDNGDGDDDIEDIDLDEDAWGLVTVTPLAQEKGIAAEVIGDIFYIEHPNKGVRKSAISTLHRAYATSIICAIVEESGKMEKWSPGLPLQLQATVRDRGKEVLMMVTVKTWIEEEDSANYIDASATVGWH